ncbi:MAG: YibE/F family protein [Oscillospiraceae bacterium]|jgi:uncharacterized membrane protein|nr:YibE/F family protein [Oscillospiraceae bacterium]
MDKKTIAWVAYLLCATALLLGAVVFLISQLLGAQDLLCLVFLALTICGAGSMLGYGVKMLFFPKKADSAPVVPTKKLQANKRPAAQLRSRQNLSRALTILILALASLLFFFARNSAMDASGALQSTVAQATVYEKAEVLRIEENAFQHQQDFEDVPVGHQLVLLELLGGEFEGTQLNAKNNLSYLYGTVLKEGDRVTVALTLNNGEIESFVLADYDRSFPLFLVVLAFIVVTVLVGGKVGAKSLLGLGLTILCIFGVMIPLLFKGYPTIPTILIMCAYVTVVEFTILGGVNKKTLCAILGTIAGVVLAALFGQLACALTRIDGFKMYVSESSIEALLQIKQTQSFTASLQLGDLLSGGIIIAALGAVNDVAMSISSAMNELIAVDPTLTRRQLLKSGMNIGRDMVGTMTNTVILAITGSSLALLMYLWSQTPSLQQLFSTAFTSVEIVQVLASSVGVILAVPLSALIGTLLFAKPHRKPAGKKA